MISGSGAFTKDTNSSTVTLLGINTYTGNTTISAGTLQIGGAGQLASGTYAGSIANNGTLQYSSSAAQTFSGVISGAGNLVKDTNAGTLVISGINTYTGNTTISAGTVQISGSGQLGSGNYAGSIANNATLEYSSSANQSLTGVISGAGALTKDTNTSTLTLGASNTYTGITTIGDGTLVTSVLGNNGETSSSLGANRERPTARLRWGTRSITLLTVELLSMSVPRPLLTTLLMSLSAVARTQLTHRARGS